MLLDGFRLRVEAKMKDVVIHGFMFLSSHFSGVFLSYSNSYF